jgi:DNA-binding NarL/FixJ family response regulator
MREATTRRSTMEPLRVLIAESNRLFAEALMFTLDSDPRLDAVGYSLDAREARELAESYEPDVLLIGSGLGVEDQVELARRTLRSHPRLLVVLLRERLVPHEVEQAYALGAADCLPMSRSADDLLHAISAARKRRIAFERGLHARRRRTALELGRRGAVGE